MRKVVITGMGVISPVGIGHASFWQSLKNGKCGIDICTKADTSTLKVKLAAEVRDFNPSDFLDKKDIRRNDLYAQYAMAAAKLAVEDARLEFTGIDTGRVGVIVGSGVGGLNTMVAETTKILDKGPNRVSPFFIPMMISNIAAGNICMMFGLHGISYAPVSACSTGAHAIGEAFYAIASGRQDIVLAGGAEGCINELSIGGFASMTALSEATDPNEGSLPFDARRGGFVMGEGAGVLVLESEESAVRRGATVYAELAGYGATSDAYHITAPDPEGAGAAGAMREALRVAGMSPSDIDYINAHGTGTPINDGVETLAVKAAFGDEARRVVVSSTKSMTGHLLGAAGAVEAVASALAVRDDIIPPTIHLNDPDPACDLDYCPHTARQTAVRAALSNSLAFGGHNVSLLFRKA